MEANLQCRFTFPCRLICIYFPVTLGQKPRIIQAGLGRWGETDIRLSLLFLSLNVLVTDCFCGEKKRFIDTRYSICGFGFQKDRSEKEE
jgi:hypothetical protein